APTLSILATRPGCLFPPLVIVQPASKEIVPSPIQVLTKNVEFTTQGILGLYYSPLNTREIMASEITRIALRRPKIRKGKEKPRISTRMSILTFNDHPICQRQPYLNTERTHLVEGGWS